MNYEIPETMKAWVLGDPGVLTLEEKPVPQPKKSEVLVKMTQWLFAPLIWKSLKTDHPL